MQQAQILAYGADGALAARLDELARSQGLWLRAVQHVRACRSLLRQGGPAVLVVVLGRDLVQELTLLHEVSLAFPETAAVVIGDTDHPALAALAWDLGARCVLQPPQPVELLPEIVMRLLSAGER
jgi:DNA-binding NarL/FixJ family response regulator